MSARDVLATNLNALMDRYPDLSSQQRLFRITKVATSTVGRMRRGEVSATIDNVESLAKAFHISVSEILDPKLPLRLGTLGQMSVKNKTIELAAEIQLADLNEKQLLILANTLAAMRSS